MILRAMNLSQKKKVILEIYNLLFDVKTRFEEVAAKLGIQQEDGVIIYGVVQALIIASQVIVMKKQVADLLHQENVDVEIRLKTETRFKDLKLKWKRNLMVLYN